MGGQIGQTAQGDTLFSYIRGLGSFLGGQTFEFQYFGVFRKINTFWGYEAFVDFFLGGGVFTKLDYIEWSFICILGSFLKIKVPNRGCLFGVGNFEIFFGVLEIPDIFFNLGWAVDAWPEPTYEEKMRQTDGGICRLDE